MIPQMQQTPLDSELGVVFCSSLLLFSAGCLGLPSSGGSSTIDAQNLTLERGEAGALRVEATDISEMWVDDYPAGDAQMVVDDLVVNLSSDEVISRPDIRSQADSYPPIWVWNEVESNVTVKIPITASENASSGQYSFEIRAESDTDEINDTATVRVVERNEN